MNYILSMALFEEAERRQVVHRISSNLILKIRSVCIVSGGACSGEGRVIHRSASTFSSAPTFLFTIVMIVRKATQSECMK